MKSKFLELAGVRSEKEFYAMYPTEEAFFKEHPELNDVKKETPGVGGDLYKNVLSNFKKGLYYEANDNYQAVNDSIPDKDSQALGKYQFVPKYHWKKIQAYARQNNIDVPKTYEDFLNEPVLQEEYFENYFQKEVFPFIEQNKNKTRDLSSDELAYLYHHNGKGGAQAYITSGKLPEATKYNPSGNDFMKSYKQARESQGGIAVNGFSQGYVNIKYKQFNTEVEAINKNPNKLSEELLNEKRIQTQIKYQKQGLLPYFNGIIKTENLQDQHINKDKYEALKVLSAAMQDDAAITMPGSSKNLPRYTQKGEKGLMALDKDRPIDVRIPVEVVEQLKDNKYFQKNYSKYLVKQKVPDDYTDVLFGKSDPKYYVAKIPLVNNGSNMLNQLQNDIRTVKGNETFSIYDGKKPLSRDEDSISGFIGSFFNVSPDVNNKAVINNRLMEDSKLKFDKIDLSNQTMPNAKPYLEDIAIPDEPIDKTQPERKKETVVPTPVNPNQPTQTEMDKWIAYDKEKEQKANDGILNDYFSDERDQIAVEDPNAKKKDNFPYADMFMQAAGTIAGLSMANQKINYRDEQVNDDFRNYTAELSKLSKMGLRPEEEAYAKRMLTEAYQGSVDRVVSASNGNRNSVLGNLGRVDQQRNEGLMNLALADAQAKNESLHKYGEAMKYINEFDARRDIANNERKYQNIVATKQAGSELAGASMSAFIDSIHNYQDNKPGSWNDAYKSHMSRRFFGVDTTLKDDGTGNTPYTASWKANNDKLLLAHNQEFNQYRSIFSELKPEDQKVINDKFRESGGDIKSTYKLIDAARNGTTKTSSPYANLFKSEPIPPLSTQPTVVLSGVNTEATPVLNNNKAPDLISGNMPAYQPISENSSDATLNTLKAEGEKNVFLMKENVNQVRDTFDKINQGVIGSEQGNTVLDQLLKNAEKMF